MMAKDSKIFPSSQPRDSLRGDTLQSSPSSLHQSVFHCYHILPASLELTCLPGQNLWKAGYDDGEDGFNPYLRFAAARAGAVVVWAVGGLLRLGWLLSWSVALTRTAKPKSKILGIKRAMQSDLHAATGASFRQSKRDRSGRPRFCKHRFESRGCVDRDRPLPDRVYHCSHLEKKCEEDPRRPPIVHLPVYDHYCSWLGVIVYLDTIKPYLLLIGFLVLDAIVVFSCSIAATSLPRSMDFALHGSVTALATVIALWLGTLNGIHQFRHLAMQNITAPERAKLRNRNAAEQGGGRSFFALQVDNELVYDRFQGNPWDLGRKRNLHQILGGWDCLVPWTPSPRCVGYGNLRDRSDFEMSDHFWRWVEETEVAHRSRAAGSRPASSSSQPPLDVAGAPPAAALLVPLPRSAITVSPLSSPGSNPVDPPISSPSPPTPQG